MVTFLVVVGTVVVTCGLEVLRVGPWVEGGDGGPWVERETTGGFLDGGAGGPRGVDRY